LGRRPLLKIYLKALKTPPAFGRQPNCQARVRRLSYGMANH
jgi:hypothetical protein